MSIYLIQLAVCGVVELIVWFAVAVFVICQIIIPFVGHILPLLICFRFVYRFMSGELQLQNVGGAAAPAGPAVTTASAPTSISSSPTAGVVPNPPQQLQQQPTTVVELKQMLTLDDLTDDAEYEDILEDTREECASFGILKNIIIPRSGPGATKIFLEYLTVEDAGSAINGLAGRTFGGRKVEAVYFDPVKFANQDYSD